MQSTEWIANVPLPRNAMPIRLRPAEPLSDDAYYDLCRKAGDLRVERTADGEIIIMPPTGGETGRRNLELAVALGVWAKKDDTGVCFDSSTEFILPNRAGRSPDASWVKKSRWEALTQRQRDRFPPLCPDFVLELKSPSDDLDDLHAKMREYMENGAELGWLIDPESRRVWIYRAGEREPACLESPDRVSGDPVLAGFVLDLAPIW